MRTDLYLPLLVATALLAGAPRAHATQTDPVLLVAAARVLPGAGGSLVEIDASFPQADLVQREIPVQVLLRSHPTANGYVRFPLGGAAVAGGLGSLGDGLDAGDVPALLGGGSALPGARLLRLAPGRIELWLPAASGLDVGVVELFLVYEGDAILSNPAPVEEIAP